MAPLYPTAKVETSETLEPAGASVHYQAISTVGALIIRIGFRGDAGESLSTKSETKDDICMLKECVYTRLKKVSTTCCK